MFNKLKRIILNLGFLNRIFGKKIIHLEGIYFTSKKLKKHLRKYKSKCYCVCPVNYEYFNSFLVTNLTKNEFYKSLKKNYLELKEMRISLQLHVHLALLPNRLSYAKKESMIKSAYDFFVKELDIVPTEIVFGWYSSDKESIEIANSFGLKVIKEHLHIYDWWLE
jgi:hypothetical protein